MGNYLPAIAFPTGVVISSFGMAWYNVAVISSTGSLYVWGYNQFGNLGVGHSNDIGDSPSEMGDNLVETMIGSGRDVMDVRGGNFHNCVLLDNWDMKCFGSNGWGEGGYGSQSSRGDEPFEMGNYLPAINVGSGKNVINMQLGYRFTCVILNDDSLKCFGQNDLGQLGYGDTEDRGDDSNEMSDYLSPVNLGVGVTVMECSDYSPTMAPSISVVPTLTIAPTYMPSLTPPTMAPTYKPTWSPSFSAAPTKAPVIYIEPDCKTRLSFEDSMCALSQTNFQMKCWGDNGSGKLGFSYFLFVNYYKNGI